MVRRLVAIRVPESRAKLVVARLEELGHDALWVDHNDGRTLIEVIVDKGAVGDLLDKIAESEAAVQALKDRKKQIDLLIKEKRNAEAEKEEAVVSEEEEGSEG